MIMNDDIKAVVENSAYLTLVTLMSDGTPHPIIAGKGEVAQGAIVFGIYKMETTRKNLAADPRAWVVTATKEGGPKGYRLSGTAAAREQKLVFTPDKADKLL